MHRSLLPALLVALTACSPASKDNPVKSAEAARAQAEEPVEPAPLSAEAERIHAAFSVRHDPPSCKAVTAELDSPHGALVEVVEVVELPPWVPMLAASCLVELYPEAEADRFVTWVTDPSWAGTGRMVLNELDALPEPVALRVGEASLRGALSDVAAARLQASKRPALRALVASE